MLREILEELNNGRVEGRFAGAHIQLRVRKNCPPILRAFSEDRWNIYGIREVINSDTLKSAQHASV